MLILKNIFLILLFALATLRLASQTLTIEYFYHPEGLMTDSMFFKLTNATPSNNLISNLEIKPVSFHFGYEENYSKSVFNYHIIDTTLAALQEGYGHQIILLPITDTIKIFVGDFLDVRDWSFYGKDSLFMPWVRRFSYVSKLKHIYQLNDSLDVSAGSPIHDIVGYRVLLDSGVTKFYTKCTSKYNARIQFLESYCSKNDIPHSIKYILTQDIRLSYLINLMTCFRFESTSMNWNKADLQPLLDSLSTFNYQDEYSFKRTNLYPQASILYAYYYLPKYKKHYSSNPLLNRFLLIKNFYSSSIRDNAIADLLSHHVKDTLSIFDSLLTDFKTFSTNSTLTYLLSKERITFKESKKLTLNNILNTLLVNPNGVETSLLNVIGLGKPILIDCWASWCGPCLAENSYSKKLEKKFEGKVEFVFLSFDKDSALWREKSKELGLTNSYLIPNNFDSEFAWYFGIDAIPRYIILDKNHRLNFLNAPRPSDVEAIETILLQLL